MCDSEEDEFLSASEGENSDIDDIEELEKFKTLEVNDKPEKELKPEREMIEAAVVNINKKAEKGQNYDSYSGSTLESEPDCDPVADSELETSAVHIEDVMKKSESSEDSNLQHVEISSSQSSVASLTEEKKNLLNEVIKETEDFGSRSNSSSPDPDENTWSSPTPTKQVQEISEEQRTDRKISQAIHKTLNSDTSHDSTDSPCLRENSSGWNDWGDDLVESTGQLSNKNETSTEGWDDWSLVDDRKIMDEQPTDNIKSNILDKLVEPSKPKKEESGWGWGGLASAIGETFSSAVESSLGLPSGEEMARKTKEVDQKLEEKIPTNHFLEEEATSSHQQTSGLGGFGMFSGILSGGIDVLETIGKKTFEAVTVQEPNQGRRRLIFAENYESNLSDILKERRNQNELDTMISMGGVGSTTSHVKDVNSLFDRGEGKAYLQALEMLSQNLGKPAVKLQREFVVAMKAINTDAALSDGFTDELKKVIKRTSLPYEPQGLISTDSEVLNRLDWSDGKEPEELFDEAVQCLVDFTTSSVQVVGKLSNLLLVREGIVDWKIFIELYKILTQRLTYIGERYVEVLNFCDAQDKADNLATQIIVEVSNAIEIIQEAHKLLIPIFPS